MLKYITIRNTHTLLRYLKLFKPHSYFVNTKNNKHNRYEDFKRDVSRYSQRNSDSTWRPRETSIETPDVSCQVVPGCALASSWKDLKRKLEIDLRMEHPTERSISTRLMVNRWKIGVTCVVCALRHEMRKPESHDQSRQFGCNCVLGSKIKHR